MSESCVIREASEADIEAMVALLGELFDVESDFAFDAGRQRHGLSLLLQHDPAHVLVAERDGRVVGMCTLQCLVSTAEGGWTGMIEDVVVASGFRRYGIGTKLVDALIARAAELGIARLQLLVDRGNIGAIDFYEFTGWKPTQLRALRRYA